jgi:hypothetical protein
MQVKAIKILLGSAALVVGMALAPAAPAQISINLNLGPPPVCPYGYYDYAPYACAPYGYYGPGYFYNGIFLGVGPWAGWGYAHGWGAHRFVAAGGGRYHGRGGYEANHGRWAHGGARPGPAGRGGHPAAARGGHAGAARGGHPAARGGHPAARGGHASAAKKGGGKAHGSSKPHDDHK